MNGRKPGTIALVAVPVTISAVLIVAGIGLVSAYLRWPRYAGLLTFVGGVVGGLAAIYAAFYTSQALKLHLEQTALKNTFDMLAQIHDIDVQEIRTELDKFPYDTIAASDFYERMLEKHDVHLAVRTLLNYFELVSIAIQQRHVDEDTMYLSLSGLVPWTAHAFRPYIEEARRRRKDPHNFDQLLKLANSWESGRKLIDNQPVPPE